MSDIQIVKNYLPGSIGRVAELHGTYYHQHWGVGQFFEAKVATELSAFLERYDEENDGFWIILLNGRVEGSITIDGINANDLEAHLRWFIVSDALRGQGFGHQLLTKALDFCQTRGYTRIYLWTSEGLNAARHLYEKHGFHLIEQHRGTRWGTEVNEQRFECQLL